MICITPWNRTHITFSSSSGQFDNKLWWVQLFSPRTFLHVSPVTGPAWWGQALVWKLYKTSKAWQVRLLTSWRPLVTWSLCNTKWLSAASHKKWAVLEPWAQGATIHGTLEKTNPCENQGVSADVTTNVNKFVVSSLKNGQTCVFSNQALAHCEFWDEPELGPSALFLLREQFGDPNVLNLQSKVDLQRTYVCSLAKCGLGIFAHLCPLFALLHVLRVLLQSSSILFLGGPLLHSSWRLQQSIEVIFNPLDSKAQTATYKQSTSKAQTL